MANIAVQPSQPKEDDRRVSGFIVFMTMVAIAVMALLGWLIHRSWSDYNTSHARESLVAICTMSLVLAFMVSVAVAITYRTIRNLKS